MKLNHIIYTENELISPRWLELMPEALIQTVFTKDETFSNTLIWVVTGIPHWQDIIKFYHSNGNQVLALTRNGSTDEVIAALNAGAKGYLDLFSNTTILEQAANAVTNGALWLPASIVTGLIGSLTVKMPIKNDEELNKLTKRELDVVKEIKTGLSNKEIARRLAISERTVKEHLSSIFSKLEVSDRFQLILKLKA
ncbi:hypothetical protein GCM10010919_30450 [Alishewanella longhuensis]|uniref:HTH luxR-type domain-containing protein n=1 Tax=Alishewanella longhuensis TaxID=1091037 RepID=A0ABQ3L1K1_9ALTE|nr:response regulator transcription factor [Alishewanella longhuensis]GHG75834.1 hypothetical protein GCM10010919_30450 [Alishewanella longhuensis]